MTSNLGGVPCIAKGHVLRDGFDCTSDSNAVMGIRTFDLLLDVINESHINVSDSSTKREVSNTMSVAQSGGF